MKKNLFLVLLLFAVPFAIALAAELKVGEQTSTSATETFTDDLYTAGGTVSNAANVTGDLVAVGGSVNITGSVSEDVFAGGGSVNVLGAVGDDLRVGGGNILVNSKVAGDLIVGGGQVTIGGEGVGGDAVIGAGTLQINAPVSGDLRIGGGEVLINAPIGGNVYFRGDKLTLGSAAAIAGDLNYKSPKEAEIQDGARVLGTTNYEPIERRVGAGAVKGAAIGALLLIFITKFLMTLAAALVLGLLFKRYMLNVVSSVSEKPLVELGRGFATVVLMPVAAIILFITVLGIPLGAITLLGFVVLVIFGSIVAPIFLGSLVYRWARKTLDYEVTWASILVGAVLYTLLTFIPVLGWLAKFALVLMVIGAAARIKWEVAKEWR